MANECILSVDGQALWVQPSYYHISYSDQSSEDSGRTEDVEMHKNRIGTITKIELAWQGVSTEQGSQIINLFWPEYVDIMYLDLKAGGFITKTFYTGDKSGNLYNAALGRWEQIRFNIVSKKGHERDESNE